MEAKTKKYLAIVVDGSSDIRLCWPTIICDYLRKIIRYCCDKSRVEEGVRAEVELGLVFYQVQSDSGCQVQLSYWTRNVDQFLERLLHLTFNGIGGLDQSAMAVGLHNVLAMFSEIPVEMPSDEHFVVEKHCILVAASNPFLFNKQKPPDRISYTKHFGIQTDQHCTENLSKVDQLFTELAVSLSVISPKQLPDSGERFYLGNGISGEIDPSLSCRGNGEYNVLLSKQFKEAHTALNPQNIASSSSEENVEPKNADIITFSSESQKSDDILSEKDLEWLHHHRGVYDEIIGSWENTPGGSIHVESAQNELGDSSPFQEMSNELHAVQTNAHAESLPAQFVEVELESIFSGPEEQMVAPQNQNVAESREEKDEWKDMIANLYSEDTDISSQNTVETSWGSSQPAVGHDFANTEDCSNREPNTVPNLEMFWKNTYIQSSLGGDTTPSTANSFRKATSSQFPAADSEIMMSRRVPRQEPIGNILSPKNPNNEILRLRSRGSSTAQNTAWHRGGINSGPNLQQQLLGSKRNVASAFGQRLPPAAEAISKVHRRTYSRGLLHVPSVPMEEMPGYVNSWQGTVVGEHRGQIYFFSKAKAYRREAAPAWLTASWPPYLQLGYVTPQSALDKIGGNRGPIEFVIIETLDHYDDQIYENMRSKDLSIKISLPSQTLFLAPSNLKSRFIATVLHKSQDFPKLMPNIVSSSEEQPRESEGVAQKRRQDVNRS